MKGVINMWSGTLCGNRRLNCALFCILSIIMIFIFTSVPMKTKLLGRQWLAKDEPKRTLRDSQIPIQIFTKKAHTSQQRRNVIILTHMSSGSTFLGNLFNFHPDVFYLYEPLNVLRTQRYKDEWHFLEKVKNDAYRIEFWKLMRDLFSCDFREENTMSLIIPKFLRKIKEFATWTIVSPKITKKSARDICKQRGITVAKIMQTRLPRDIGIQELQRVCSSDPENFDCLIIHLVRDPRAVLSSLLRRTFFYGGIKKKLFQSKTPDARNKVIKHNAHVLCSQVEENLKFIKDMPDWFEGRYILIRYEDVVGNITKTVDDLYKFVGLPMVDDVRKWIFEGVQPVKTRRTAFSMPEDSENLINHWRLERDSSVVSLVEDTCGPLMKLLGYLHINGSLNAQHNLRKTLRTAEIPALKLER